MKIANVWGIEILNTTPHGITFGREDCFETIAVPPSGILISAKVVEVNVKKPLKLEMEEIDVECVSTNYLPNQKGWELLNEVPDRVVIVGSIIAAQAYPGLVFGMVPCAGFERVPIQEKRMRHNKFTMF